MTGFPAPAARRRLSDGSADVRPQFVATARPAPRGQHPGCPGSCGWPFCVVPSCQRSFVVVVPAEVIRPAAHSVRGHRAGTPSSSPVPAFPRLTGAGRRTSPASGSAIAGNVYRVRSPHRGYSREARHRRRADGRGYCRELAVRKRSGNVRILSFHRPAAAIEVPWSCMRRAAVTASASR